MKDIDNKRQLAIAKSLYEMGIDEDIIKKITTVESKDLSIYRLTLEKNRNVVDNKNKKSI